jgi:Down syndrome cell adhesion protein 1
VLASGPNSAIVSWLPPSHPNGIITKYKITWKSEDPEGVKEKYHSPSIEEDQMFMEVRRLKENKRYSFWVTPATSLGFGRPTAMESVMISSKGMHGESYLIKIMDNFVYVNSQGLPLLS